jgi:hypothetical protein
VTPGSAPWRRQGPPLTQAAYFVARGPANLWFILCPCALNESSCAPAVPLHVMHAATRLYAPYFCTPTGLCECSDCPNLPSISLHSAGAHSIWPCSQRYRPPSMSKWTNSSSNALDCSEQAGLQDPAAIIPCRLSIDSVLDAFADTPEVGWTIGWSAAEEAGPGRVRVPAAVPAAVPRPPNRPHERTAAALGPPPVPRSPLSLFCRLEARCSRLLAAPQRPPAFWTP